MDEKLKPCPFCGEGFIHLIDVGNGLSAASCWECGAYMANDFKTPKEAIKAWNRRAK